MLDVSVPRVVLDGAGVLAVIGELEAGGMTEHVLMHRHAQVGTYGFHTDLNDAQWTIVAPLLPAARRPSRCCRQGGSPGGLGPGVTSQELNVIAGTTSVAQVKSTVPPVLIP